MKSFFFSLLVIAAWPTVWAAEQPLVVTEDVVVTATRFREPAQDVPVGVTVITAEQIRNSTAATLPELLKQHPGIQVRDNSGSPNQQVDMRGFGITGDQNTLVLLDGRRISENEQATVNWSAIPLSSIARIEIMRGSGAVLYGGGATGGTINIITKAPQFERKSGYASAGVGNYGTTEFRAGADLGGERLGMIVNGSHLETDNYRDNNRLRQSNAQADVRWRGDDGTLYVKFGADDQQLQLPGALTEAQIAVNRRQAATPGDFSHTSGGYANVGGDVKIGDGEFAINAGYRGKTANSAFFVATPFRNNISTQVNITNVAPRARIPFQLGSANHTLVTGLDWDDWDYDSTAGPSVASHPLSFQRNTAWYFQDAMAFGAHTVLSLGARIHHTSYGVTDVINNTSAARDHDLRAFEVAARHNVSDALSVYGKFGNSFRVPNVNDIYNLFAATITMLEPQTSHDREVGAELRSSVGSYRLAVYEMDINNEIHSNPDPATNFLIPNINLPPTRRYGFELNGKWQLTDALSAYANYTYAVAKFRDGAFGGVSVVDKDVPLVPRNSANVGGAWEVAPRTRLNMNINYVGEQIFDGDETNTFGRKMPAYTLVDLKLTTTVLDHWQFDAGVRNLLNEKYFSYGVYTGFPTFVAYPEAERSFFVSAQYNFK